jgi:cold shock CspA family protein
MSEFNMLTDIIRTTVGRVIKYNKESGFGFIKVADDIWNDAFVSHRDIEPEVSGIKKLDEGQHVAFDLHKNSKGFVARNVKLLTEEQYKNVVQAADDNRFNK